MNKLDFEVNWPTDPSEELPQMWLNGEGVGVIRMIEILVKAINELSTPIAPEVEE